DGGSGETFSKVSPENVSFIATTGHLLTRPVAYVICIVLWLKIVVSAGFELRVFLELSRDVMLPNTPMFVVGLVMILACAYAAGKGIETRARVAEVLFALMILPVIIFFIVALLDANFSNLQPLHVNNAGEALRGVRKLGFILTGLECLLLITPYVSREKNLPRAVAGATALAGGLIVALTTITIASLGTGTESEKWPVVRLMDAISLPGAFIERQEALMFGFWIITAFALGNAMLFFGGLLVQNVRSKSSLHVGVGVTAVAVFGISLLPFSSERIFSIMDGMFATSGIFFLVVLPIALLIAAKIVQNGRHKILAKTAALLILAAFAGVLLTGCWDKVEIEERAFVAAIGIDTEDDEYIVTISVPIFNDDDNREEDEHAHIKTTRADKVCVAIQELCDRDERQLYFGQTQIIIFSNELLTDNELLDGATESLKKHLQASRRITVLRADCAADVLKKKPPEKIIPYGDDSPVNFYDFVCSYRESRVQNNTSP
ncbi:MAG: endospore germination permease, partial [Defluviitaleaceae bacterium]|nr:endospore germination permease [Defluviitaleaceae bacterium]